LYPLFAHADADSKNHYHQVRMRRIITTSAYPLYLFFNIYFTYERVIFFFLKKKLCFLCYEFVILLFFLRWIYNLWFFYVSWLDCYANWIMEKRKKKKKRRFVSIDSYEYFEVVSIIHFFFFLILHIFGVVLYFRNKPKRLKIGQNYF